MLTRVIIIIIKQWIDIDVEHIWNKNIYSEWDLLLNKTCDGIEKCQYYVPESTLRFRCLHVLTEIFDQIKGAVILDSGRFQHPVKCSRARKSKIATALVSETSKNAVFRD